MDTIALADEPAVATDAPPRWSELIASRLGRGTATTVEDPTTAEARATVDDATAGVEEATEGRKASDAGTVQRGGATDPEPLAPARWWVLVAPLAGAVGLSAAAWSFEPNPLRTGTSPSGLLAFAVLIPFFLVCVASTLAVIRDATRLRAAGAEWSPNPWHYVVPSAVVLTAIDAFPVIRSARGTEELIGFLAGSLVVALAASSILAGPAYLLQRRRRLGGDR